MLSEALEYPRRGADWLQTVGIGGIITFLSFVPVLPQILLFGYYKRVLSQTEGGQVLGDRGAASGSEPGPGAGTEREGGSEAESETGADAAGDRTGTSESGAMPPVFDEWEDLLVDGLKAWLVSLVYGAVPGLLLGFVAFFGAIVLGVGAFGLSAGDGGDPGAGAVAGFTVLTLVFVLVVLALSLVVLFVAGYLMPAAVALYARTDDLGAAFDLGRLRRVTLTREYAMAWLLAAVVLVVGSMIGGLLVVVFFLGVFVIFYVTVVAVRLVGVGVDRALAAGDRAGGEATEEAWR